MKLLTTITNPQALGFRKAMMLTAATAMVLAATPVGFHMFADGLSVGENPAAAAEGSSGGHGGGAQGSQGAGGHYGNQGSGHSSGQVGPSEDSDANGPRYGGGTNANKPGSGTQGGKPAWAQEGIPEVELGRMNVARAPEHVLDKAGAEAIANFTSTGEAALYSMSAEAFADYIKDNYSTATRIDSPLENLALYKDVLSDGQTNLPGVTPKSTIDLAAILLGSASDKTVAITPDTVGAINTILGLPVLTPTDTALLAEKADAVREAILEGHGGGE